MCCCNRSSSARCCCCGSSCGCNCGCGGGITTLPAFPDVPDFPGISVEANTRFPVYVSYPAFLTDVPEEGGGCGCGR